MSRSSAVSKRRSFHAGGALFKVFLVLALVLGFFPTGGLQMLAYAADSGDAQAIAADAQDQAVDAAISESQAAESSSPSGEDEAVQGENADAADAPDAAFEAVEAEAKSDAACALIYSDGTMVFQYGDEPDASHGDLLYSYDGFESETYSGYGSVPWYSQRSSVKTVEFADGFVPAGIAYWFYGMESLESASLPEGLGAIGDYAFSGCASLASIELPASVSSVGISAFEGCTSLASVTFAEGSKLASVDYYAFSGCTSLASIELPASVSSVRNRAFRGCTSLSSIGVDPDNAFYTSAGGMLCSKDGGTLYCCPPGRSEAEIPASVEAVGDYAFEGCASLASIELPASVSSIGYCAFYGCTSLASIELPASVPSVGDCAFFGCTSLASVGFAEGSKLVSLGAHAFYNCTSLTSIELPASVSSVGYCAFAGCASLTGIELPASVSSVGSSAFAGCTSLTSIELPASVSSVGSSAFAGCASLTFIGVDDGNASYASVDGLLCSKDGRILHCCPGGRSEAEIPATVDTIDDYAFYRCAQLPSVGLAEGSKLRTVGSYAFFGCTSLASIELPASVVSVGDCAFSRCASLASVTFAGDEPSFGSDAFYGCTTTAYYPKGNATWRFEATYPLDRQFGGTITWEPWDDATACALVYSDGTMVFQYGIGADASHGELLGRYTGFESETYSSPDSVPWHSQRGSVKAVVFADGFVPADTAYWFYGMENLESVSLPEGLEAIGERAFEGCTSLSSIELPASVASVGSCAFNGCTALASMTVAGRLLAKGDVNNNGRVNIVDAQIVLDMSDGAWTAANAAADGAYGLLLDALAEAGTAWNLLTLRLAADVNGDDAVDALDARAIQTHAHMGEWR